MDYHNYGGNIIHKEDSNRKAEEAKRKAELEEKHKAEEAKHKAEEAKHKAELEEKHKAELEAKHRADDLKRLEIIKNEVNLKKKEAAAKKIEYEQIMNKAKREKLNDDSKHSKKIEDGNKAKPEADAAKLQTNAAKLEADVVELELGIDKLESEAKQIKITINEEEEKHKKEEVIYKEEEAKKKADAESKYMARMKEEFDKLEAKKREANDKNKEVDKYIKEYNDIIAKIDDIEKSASGDNEMKMKKKEEDIKKADADAKEVSRLTKDADVIKQKIETTKSEEMVILAEIKEKQSSKEMQEYIKKTKSEDIKKQKEDNKKKQIEDRKKSIEKATNIIKEINKLREDAKESRKNADEILNTNINEEKKMKKRKYMEDAKKLDSSANMLEKKYAEIIYDMPNHVKRRKKFIFTIIAIIIVLVIVISLILNNFFKESITKKNMTAKKDVFIGEDLIVTGTITLDGINYDSINVNSNNDVITADTITTIGDINTKDMKVSAALTLGGETINNFTDLNKYLSSSVVDSTINILDITTDYLNGTDTINNNEVNTNKLNVTTSLTLNGVEYTDLAGCTLTPYSNSTICNTVSNIYSYGTIKCDTKITCDNSISANELITDKLLINSGNAWTSLSDITVTSVKITNGFEHNSGTGSINADNINLEDGIYCEQLIGNYFQDIKSIYANTLTVYGITTIGSSISNLNGEIYINGKINLNGETWESDIPTTVNKSTINNLTTTDLTTKCDINIMKSLHVSNYIYMPDHVFIFPYDDNCIAVAADAYNFYPVGGTEDAPAPFRITPRYHGYNDDYKTPTVELDGNINCQHIDSKIINIKPNNQQFVANTTNISCDHTTQYNTICDNIYIGEESITFERNEGGQDIVNITSNHNPFMVGRQLFVVGKLYAEQIMDGDNDIRMGIYKHISNCKSKHTDDYPCIWMDIKKHPSSENINASLPQCGSVYINNINKAHTIEPVFLTYKYRTTSHYTVYASIHNIDIMGGMIYNIIVSTQKVDNNYFNLHIHVNGHIYPKLHIHWVAIPINE